MLTAAGIHVAGGALTVGRVVIRRSATRTTLPSKWWVVTKRAISTDTILAKRSISQTSQVTIGARNAFLALGLETHAPQALAADSHGESRFCGTAANPLYC